MRRREIVAFAAAALASPLTLAQRARRPFRIVWPAVSPLSVIAPLAAAFEQGLRDLGHVPGKDVVIEYRSADGKPERYPEVVRQVVDSGPDLIITGANSNTIAVKAGG